MTLGAVLGATATAGTVVLTFEGLGNEEEVLSYFSGSTGSLGSGPGPNYGITFTSNGEVFLSADSDFAGNPSGDAAFTFISDPGTMDVVGGFTTGFSFYYSAISAPGTISIYAGPDGTGALLASFSPPETPSEAGSGVCSSGDLYCPFFPDGVSFPGTAESVVFTGVIALDDITLGSSTPGIPEPPAFSLLGLGLASLLVISRRRRKPSEALEAE